MMFREVLACPETIDCTISGQKYDVYQFNTEYKERPLIVYLGLGTTALTGMGKAYLDGYVSAIDRPIVTVHPHADSWNNFSERARSDVNVMDTIGIEDMDIVGASSGGMLASYVAASAGGRVRHLVTVSCVGTKKGYMDYVTSLPNQFIDGMKEAMLVKKQHESLSVFSSRSSNFFNVAHYSELLKTIRHTVNSSLADTIMTLDDATQWIDIVGTKDHMTDYRDHLAIVRQRNHQLPHSSSLHLLGGESHMWAAKQAVLCAMVRAAID